MKKLFLIGFLFLSILSFAQDGRPSGLLTIQSPGFYYYQTDSSVWVYKGSALGWTKLASKRMLKHSIDSLSVIYQPLENQRLSTTNSPTFAGGNFLGGILGGSYINFGAGSAQLVGVGSTISGGFLASDMVVYNTGGDLHLLATGAKGLKITATTGEASLSAGLQVNGSASVTGYLGVGTTAPDEKLHISGGDLKISGTANPRLMLHNTSASGKNWSVYSNGVGNLIFGRTGVADYVTIADGSGNATFSSNITAASFIKSGGTSAQYLLADGSVTTTAGAVYKGQVNGSTGSGLADGTGTTGWYYACSVAGTYNYGSGNITLAVGDQLYYNGTIWLWVPGAGSYTLPVASGSVLGGVKSSASVSIDGGGVMSVSTAYAPSSTISNATHTGDVTGSTALTLATVNTAGTYTKVTTDAKGRVTSGTTLSSTDIPTLNQNTTGNAATANNARYVYDDGVYSGVTGYKEASALYVTYASTSLNWIGSSALGSNAYSSAAYLPYRTFGTAANSASADFAPAGTVSFPGFGSTSTTSATGNHTHSIYVPYTGATANVNLGTYTITGGNFQLSDRRLKRNIRSIANLSDFSKVKFVQYSMRADSTNKKHYGVIAQDLEKIAPELVNTDEKGTKSVNYTELLIAKIAELENRIKQLESAKELITSPWGDVSSNTTYQHEK